MQFENASLEEIQAYFAGDKFATVLAGCSVVEASKGHAVAEMPITDNHRNAVGGVMGGAIFTLADFALAVACNVGEEPTVSITNCIQYLSGSRGTKLIATAHVVKSGRTVGYYEVDITDDMGRDIAKMTATCHR